MLARCSVDSALCVRVRRLLRKLKAEGHKVLLFCQSVEMLDILQDYVAYRGWPYERLDGSVRR